MELHGARIQVGEVEALDRPVVQGDRRRLRVLGRLHGEPMVLRGDEHAAQLARQHRMVGAAVAERQLEGLVVGGEAEQLMAEADPEDGRAPEEVADDRGLLDERIGSPGPFERTTPSWPASVSASTVCG